MRCEPLKEEKILFNHTGNLDEDQADKAVSDLDHWYRTNITFLPSYRHMLEKNINYIDLNKKDRLQLCYRENLDQVH